MKIEEVPLAAELRTFIGRKGITELYPPQEEAVKQGLLEGISLVISSPTACYDGKTEVLTRSGWKPFAGTQSNEEVLSMNPETFEMEYVRAEKKMEYFYRGTMIHVEGKEIDFRVTENHNMFVHHRHKLTAKDPKTAKFVSYSGLRYDFHPAREISHNWKFVTGGIWKGRRKEYLELPPISVHGRYPSSKGPLPAIRIPIRGFLNFFGWYIAEGSTKYGDGDCEVTICQSKDPMHAKAALAELGLGRVYVTGPKSHRHFSVSNPQLARYLSEFGKAYEKFLPDFVKELAPDEIKIFLESYRRGDGHIGKDGKSPIFNTTSKRLADDVQELLLKVGVSSSVRLRGISRPHAMPDGHVINQKHPSYEIAGRQFSEHGIDYRRPSKPSFEITRGEMVYCLGLPKHHLLYVRRNGKAFWCGNSGKTLIAIMAAFRTVKGLGRKVVYLAPLRALASEKYSEFSELDEFGIKTAISTGDFDTSGESLGRADIIVLTNERFDSLMRQRTSWLGSVGLFIADEVHLAGNDSRGPTLEMILTKIVHLGLDAQLLSLSATISNAKTIAEWLKSKPVELDWRPVPLRQAVFDYGRLLFEDGEERKIVGSSYGPAIDVAMDTVKEGGQSLVFANTRRRAVSLATKASEVTARFLSEEEKRALGEASSRILTSGEETSLSSLLASLVAKGAAFHHAGLEHEHRKIVEDYYRVRAIKVLAATPTLCLPAGEEILCNAKPERIEKLNSSHRVLTHLSRFRRVIAPVSRPHRGRLLEISTHGQLPMRMTPEHKVLRVKRSRHSIHAKNKNVHWWTYTKPEWVEAKDIQKGNLVMFPRLKEQKDVRAVKLPPPGKLKNQFGVTGYHWTRLKIDEITLDERSLEFLGLYLAEGYSQDNGAVYLAINQGEKLLTQIITSWFSSAGLRWSLEDRARHRRVIYACSKQLANKLREMFGEHAPDKHLPDELFLLPNDKLIPLIRGLWLGDGSISLQSGEETARLTTTSRALAKQLFTLLVKLGFMPSLTRGRVGDNSGRKSEKLDIVHKHDQYEIRIAGKQLGEFCKVVLKRIIPDVGNRQFNINHIDDDYYYMLVRGTRSFDFEGLVYNLEVEGDNSYVGSFVVHNSAGVNLPARRVVVADLSRYDVQTGGNSPISVLEYRQMAGRAGRPQYDDHGETVIIPPTSQPALPILEYYAKGPPEPIKSRLADEAAMRMHTLATVATSSGLPRSEVQALFRTTLLAQQVGEQRVWKLVEAAMGYLIVEGLVEAKGDRFFATEFGRRVSMLYIDPATGVLFRNALRKAEPDKSYTTGLLELIAKSPDFEPKFPLRSKDYDQAIAFMEEHHEELLERPKARSFADYDDVLQEMRTVMVLHGWIDEWREEQILTKLGAEPGDIHRAVDNANWLLHSLGELSKLFTRGELKKQVETLRLRVEAGVSDELVELTLLQGIGRVRARALYTAGFKTIEDIKEAPADKLALVEKVGNSVARRIKEQVSRY